MILTGDREALAAMLAKEIHNAKHEVPFTQWDVMPEVNRQVRVSKALVTVDCWIRSGVLRAVSPGTVGWCG